MGIVAKALRYFHGGVHPKEYKELSEHCSIAPLPMPKKLYVPVQQHIGAPTKPVVKAGDKVLKGQLIGAAQGFVSAPIHAPTSGTVTGVEEYSAPHPSGLTMPCIVIETDGKDEWDPNLKGLDDPLNAEPQAIRDKIKEGGIVGLGGATFPSFIKMSPPKGKTVDMLIINAVECEPYLTCDARVMEERTRDIIEGIEIMLRALGTDTCMIGIEVNKPRAIRAMQKAVESKKGMEVVPLRVMYPQGSEKQLIEVITGRQVPSGGLPLDVGVIVHNVITAVAMRDAVKFGRPLVDRIVTVTGLGIAKPANVEAPLGTPSQEIIDHCGGLVGDVQKVIMGGPMMGMAMRDLKAPIVKGSSGLLCLTRGEGHAAPEGPCIRCGACLEACPIELMPTEMAWHSRHEQLDMLPEYNLFDCIECGSCAYVCPSNIPLVQYFRFGKMSIAAAKRDKEKQARSKARTEAKEAREAKIKAEKERKKAEMKAKMAAKKAAAAAAKAAEEKAAGEPAT